MIIKCARHLRTFATTLALVAASTSFADDLEKTCLSLANSGLVDTRNIEVIASTMQKEFHDICNSKADKTNQLRSSSGAFQGAFKAFGFGLSGGSNAQSETETIQRACDAGEKQFQNYIYSSDKASSGKYLADSVVQCVEVLSRNRKTSIFGIVKVEGSDDGFSVDIHHTPGETDQSFSLVSIAGPSHVSCYSGQPKKVGDDQAGKIPDVGILKGNSNVIIYCSKQKGESAEVGFVFESSQKWKKSVSASVRSVDREKETAEAIRTAVRRELDGITSRIATLESKSVEFADALKVSAEKLEKSIDVKTRPQFSFDYIYAESALQTPGNGVYEWVTDKGLRFNRKRLISASEGVCVLSAVGDYKKFYNSPDTKPLHTEHLLEIIDGYWNARVLKSADGGFVGVGCWKFK